MYLLTYSFARWGDNRLTQRTVIARDWTATLVRKHEEHKDATLAVVFLLELPPLGDRRLGELRAAGVEVEQ